MKFTLSFLKRFLETTATVEEIAEVLTSIGIEVESVIDKSKQLEPFLVAEILKATPHPNADTLNVCEVNDGRQTLQIICGAHNARAGIKVVLAPIGATIPTNGMVIEKRMLRGVESQGMLCSSQELGLGEDSSGIIELPESARVGDRFIDAFPEHVDPLFDVSITPNRSDCLSVYGIARDLSAKGIGKLIEPEFETLKAVSAKKLHEKAPLFAYVILKDITNNETPEWLKNLLENSGHTSRNAIIDITNYINLAFGRPMHAFDLSKLEGNLTVRNAVNKEEVLALDGVNYALKEGDIVVADKEKVCAVAGIIGSESTKCDMDTREILLEAAVFDQISVAYTARRLGVHTESKQRFERGVDYNNTLGYLNLAASMVKEICGAEIEDVKICGEPSVELKTVELREEDFVRLTGVALDIKTITDVLTRLQFQCESGGPDVIVVTVPSWRNDIELKEDLVEEVLRIYGYDKLELTPPELAKTFDNRFAKEELYDRLRTVAIFSGCFEVVTWSFMHSVLANEFGIYREDLVLKNPISSELDCLRGSIIPNLLQAVHKNNLRGFDNTSFFEIGPVFASGAIGDQSTHFSSVKSGCADLQSVHGSERRVDFFDIKKDVLSILSVFGIAEHELKFTKGTDLKWSHPAKSATIYYQDNVIGVLGEIHPSILQLIKIKSVVVGCELFLSKIPQNISIAESVISDYQEVSRDFAFVVDKDLASGEVVDVIRKVGGVLVKDVRIFDVFINEKIGEDKKSLAINVRLQSALKTLDELEINDVSSRVVSGVEQECGGVLR